MRGVNCVKGFGAAHHGRPFEEFWKPFKSGSVSQMRKACRTMNRLQILIAFGALAIVFLGRGDPPAEHPKISETNKYVPMVWGFYKSNASNLLEILRNSADVNTIEEWRRLIESNYKTNLGSLGIRKRHWPAWLPRPGTHDEASIGYWPGLNGSPGTIVADWGGGPAHWGYVFGRVDRPPFNSGRMFYLHWTNQIYAYHTAY